MGDPPPREGALAAVPGNPLVRYNCREGVLMLSCKDVTKLLSESMDRSLPIGKRIGVRLHLLICKFCARYERQFFLIRETARHLATTLETPGGSFGETLSVEARDRIRKSIKNA